MDSSDLLNGALTFGIFAGFCIFIYARITKVSFGVALKKILSFLSGQKDNLMSSNSTQSTIGGDAKVWQPQKIPI